MRRRSEHDRIERKLRSSVLALIYFDAVNGKSATIATAKDTAGEVIPPNQIIYRDAFDHLRADVLYTYRRTGLEQDIILREQPPGPQALGLLREATRLEVLTEFFVAPQPQKRQIVLDRVDDPALRAAMAAPDWIDEELDFGPFRIPQGKAFLLGGGPAAEDAVIVGKEWTTTAGQRTILIESVDYLALLPQLEQLPAPGGKPGAAIQRRGGTEVAKAAPKALPLGRRLTQPLLQASGPAPVAQRRGRALPQRQLAGIAPPARREIVLAQAAKVQSPGLVLDYTTVSTGQSSYTFKGDETYYITGTVGLSATTTFEAGTVIKFAAGNTLQLNSASTLKFQGAPYRPVVLTAKDDDSVGQTISGSSGNPSGYYANPALSLNGASTSGYTLTWLRIKHAQVGLQFVNNGASAHTVRHLQIVNCDKGIQVNSATLNLRNALMAGTAGAFACFYNLSSATLNVQHLTAHNASYLNYNPASSTLQLVNSLVVAVANTSGYTDGGGNQVVASASGVFQSVGGGAHYLAAGSPHRNAGISGLDSTLAAELKNLTTDAPIQLTSHFTVNTPLSPQAQRDTDTPDRGYHYDPLDWCWTTLNLGNATLTLTNGVAVGNYGAKGTTLGTGAKFLSEGAPNNLNRLVRYSTVQELAWGSTASTMSLLNRGSSSPLEVRLRFTDVALLAGPTAQRRLLEGLDGRPVTLAISHSQLRGVSLNAYAYDSVANGLVIALTNNVLERCQVDFYQEDFAVNPPLFTLHLRHNLFSKGAVILDEVTYSGTWTVKDNLFDCDTLSAIGGGWAADYNGYRTNLTSLGGAGNWLNLAPDYRSGPAANGFGVLGSYYYPTSGGAGSLTNLLNRGSRTADLAGLYHFTTTINQVKEANSVVDIGYHYVAANGSNQPNDYDGDGLADYFEDKNGNGTYESASDLSHWNSADTDGDGLGDLQEYELTFNVQVNDPANDNGNEQNTQFESTCAVLNGSVIVAYVDSNQGVYGFGSFWQTYSNLPTPRFVGYSVSRDGGGRFEDKGVPPLSLQSTNTTDDGDAGDPVLAVDRASGIVYLAGTSPRNEGHKGIPLWKSTDGGVTFGIPSAVRADIIGTDKPWITVDNATGTGQHDVYLTGQTITNSPFKLWLTVSENGALNNWSTLPALRTVGDVDGATTVSAVASAIIVVGPNHVAYVVWFERHSDGINWLKMRKVENRGTTLGAIQPVRQLVTTNAASGNLKLLRSNTATNTDTFRAFPFPVPAVNPVKTSHLYVAYADKVQSSSDKADVFFLRSTDGGVNWDNGTTGVTTPKRVNNDSGLNDQWMPVLAVKPDGTKLFVGWYDRRNDANNSLIDVYGRWGTIAADGSVTFGTEFKITTVSFPPVFAGTLTGAPYTDPGHYDPAYPPEFVNLNWHYGSAWPPPPQEPPDLNLTSGAWADHVGEYNGAWAEGPFVYTTWTDNRLTSAGTLYGRNQSDIRFVRTTWPQ